MNKQKILSEINFGHRIAEEEVELLSSYFVETDSWARLYRGDIDVVYGPKGAGKSALYSLLISNQDALREKNIFLVAAENPRVHPHFEILCRIHQLVRGSLLVFGSFILLLFYMG